MGTEGEEGVVFQGKPRMIAFLGIKLTHSVADTTALIGNEIKIHLNKTTHNTSSVVVGRGFIMNHDVTVG